LSLGNGFVNPSLLGSISLTTKSDEQGEALGTAQGTASLGRILGPALGGYLYSSLSLSSPFLFSTLIVFLSLLISLKIRKSLPNSAQVLSREIDQIESFQFNNLVYGRVNFVLLHDGINFSEAFSGMELHHLSRIALVVDFNTNESKWLEKIQEAQIPEHIPVVILRSTAPLNIKSALRFKKIYKGNVCLVTQSWEALKRDMIISESSL
jgi:hypothetical protein